MRKHVLKRTLRVWSSGSSIWKLVWVWTMAFISHHSRKTANLNWRGWDLDHAGWDHRATLENKERTPKGIQRLSALLPRFQLRVALPGFHHARQLPPKAVGILSPKALEVVLSKAWRPIPPRQSSGGMAPSTWTLKDWATWSCDPGRGP